MPLSFVGRVLMVFTAPGSLGDDLRDRPDWFLAALVGMLMVVAATALIPPDVWEETMRAQLMSQGAPVPAGGPPISGEALRILGAAGAAIAWIVMLLIFASVMTFFFAFILGDELRFKQMLSAAAFSYVIAGFGSLVVTPLRLAQGDPQLTLSPGTFVENALDPGFLLYFLKGLDFFALWAFVAFAVMVSRIEPRRGFGSAFAVVGIFVVALTSFFAWLQARTLG